MENYVWVVDKNDGFWLYTCGVFSSKEKAVEHIHERLKDAVDSVDGDYAFVSTGIDCQDSKIATYTATKKYVR